MTARYLLTITDEDAVRLESWFGGQLRIGPAFDPDEDFLADLRIGNTGAGMYVPDYHRAEAGRRAAARAGVPVAGLDAITDEEYEFIHAGGPDDSGVRAEVSGGPIPPGILAIEGLYSIRPAPPTR